MEIRLLETMHLDLPFKFPLLKRLSNFEKNLFLTVRSDNVKWATGVKAEWISSLRSLQLRTFAPKSSHAQIFFKLATQKDNDYTIAKKAKTIGGHRLRFGENMPRKIP